MSALLPEAMTAVEDSAENAMRAARAALVADHPFFGALALRLSLKADRSCRDLWTDGRSLAFNPLYAAMLPRDKLIGAQAHEMLHLACGHHVRRGARDAKLWNRACDYAVNQILLNAGFFLPEGFALDADFAGMTVDAIYERLALLQDQEPNEGARDSSQQGEASTRDGKPGLTPSGGEERDSRSSPELRDTGEAEGREGKARAARPTENGALGHEGGQDGTADFQGEVRDHPFLNGMENSSARKKAELEAEILLEQAAQSARHRGSVPAGVSRLLGRELLPVLDWRALLRRFLENCADGDYSWSAPNRRYVAQGLYLPSRRELRLPRVVLAVDSSGSVDGAMLAAFCAELASVLDAYDTELAVLFHDTRVYEGPVLGRADLPGLHLTPVGGGGTDFRPVPEYIDETGLDPACVLWFTDLECDRFPEEPPYPVLWVCGGKGGETPPFGEVVHMADGEYA